MTYLQPIGAEATPVSEKTINHHKPEGNIHKKLESLGYRHAHDLRIDLWLDLVDTCWEQHLEIYWTYWNFGSSGTMTNFGSSKKITRPQAGNPHWGRHRARPVEKSALKFISPEALNLSLFICWSWNLAHMGVENGKIPRNWMIWGTLILGNLHICSWNLDVFREFQR